MKKVIKQSTLIFLLNGVSILLILLSIGAFVGALKASAATTGAQDARHSLTYNANRFINGSAYLTNEVRAFATTGNQARYDNFWNEVRNLQNRDIGIKNLREIGITPSEEAMILKMQALSDNLIPLEEQAMQLAANGSQSEALEIVFGDAYESEITQICALQNQFLESQELTRYIADISSKLDDLAKGDMTAMVQLDYVGDFMPIKRSLSVILSSFNEMMGKILSSAGQVSLGAHQMAQTANSLSVGAGKQAATIQQFTAATAETSMMAQENSELAQQAGKLMDNCLDTTKRLTQAMDDIGYNADRINKVIKVINDIAFQTNILALNASVEATRAGHYGKGFAVVASEVRNLATRSAQAARETTELIQTSSRSVAEGTGIVGDVSNVINEIGDITRKNSGFISKISQASQQQSTSMPQLSDRIGHLSDTVQTNSSAAQQSTSTAEQMALQAESFHAIVSRFRLRDTTAAPASGDNINRIVPALHPEGIALDYKEN